MTCFGDLVHRSSNPLLHLDTEVTSCLCRREFYSPEPAGLVLPRHVCAQAGGAVARAKLALKVSGALPEHRFNSQGMCRGEKDVSFDNVQLRPAAVP